MLMNLFIENSFKYFTTFLCIRNKCSLSFTKKSSLFFIYYNLFRKHLKELQLVILFLLKFIIIYDSNHQIIQITQMRGNPAKAPTLCLQVLTWEKDSHGLFDYEETKHHKNYFEIQGPCKLFRDWQTSQTSAISINQIKRGILPDEHYSFHSSIQLRHNGNIQQFILGVPEKPSQDIYRIKQSSEEMGPLNTNTYIVVRYYKGENKIPGYPIQIGDILKLGRVQFRTVELGGMGRRKGKKEKSFLKEFQGIFHATQSIQGTCKFCLCDEFSQQNYLISPCKCKGSCEMVHVQCLKMWINSKVKKQVSGVVTTYNFTKFECELCKQPFPRKVVKGNDSVQMLEIQKPNKPYVILEGINQRKQSKEERCLHLICPEEGNSIKMGRGHQCEIRLQDISVSRTHSEIKYMDGSFYLTDHNSKFGTLVRLTKQIELDHKVKLQAGRSLYEFYLQ